MKTFKNGKDHNWYEGMTNEQIEAVTELKKEQDQVKENKPKSKIGSILKQYELMHKIVETSEKEKAIKEAALSDAYMIDGNDNAYRDHDYRK